MDIRLGICTIYVTVDWYDIRMALDRRMVLKYVKTHPGLTSIEITEGLKYWSFKRMHWLLEQLEYRGKVWYQRKGLGTIWFTN